MALLDKATGLDLVKLLVFILVTTLSTAVLVVTIGNIRFTTTTDYTAEFVDATGVVKGDDIRIAGVRVGSVQDVEVVDRTRALVSFQVDEGTAINGGTEAQIRYRNLVGQRFISLSQGVGDTEQLPEGETIPVDRTKPALDLTVLFNGFKPLFQALSPDDINKLSYEIVQVFQGEAGTLEGLLGSTASVTSTLADRDAIISELIDNLSTILDDVADRDDQLADLISSFQTLVGGLKKDRQAILGSLEKVSDLSVETADLVDGIREPFVEDIKHLRAVAGNIDRNKAELDRALQVLPIKLEKVGRTAIYGSFFNFFLCEFQGKVTVPGLEGLQLPGLENGTVTVRYPFPGTKAPDRCDLG